MPDPAIGPPFNFISGTHLRLIAIDGMIQQWHRKAMTDEQAMRAVRAYVLLDECCEDCTDDYHAPMCPMWEP